eukprot:scaffold3941_cov412-Prasinococcus_capsulatus_cf.AAC.10
MIRAGPPATEILWYSWWEPPTGRVDGSKILRRSRPAQLTDNVAISNVPGPARAAGGRFGRRQSRNRPLALRWSFPPSECHRSWFALFDSPCRLCEGAPAGMPGARKLPQGSVGPREAPLEAAKARESGRCLLPSCAAPRRRPCNGCHEVSHLVVSRSASLMASEHGSQYKCGRKRAARSHCAPIALCTEAESAGLSRLSFKSSHTSQSSILWRPPLQLEPL